MSDEPKKSDEPRRVPWAAAVLVVATLVSYCGMFAFILLDDHTKPIVPILWVAVTALSFRLGMRALRNRYTSRPTQ
jgi:hypothetical protein